MEDLATKVTKIIQREDGSEVKIVAQAYFGAGLHQSIGVDVFHRTDASADFELCSDRRHPDWRTMSVDDYVKHGRSQKNQMASSGEILGVVSLIGKPMTTFEDPAEETSENSVNPFHP